MKKISLIERSSIYLVIGICLAMIVSEIYNFIGQKPVLVWFSILVFINMIILSFWIKYDYEKFGWIAIGLVFLLHMVRYQPSILIAFIVRILLIMVAIYLFYKTAKTVSR